MSIRICRTCGKKFEGVTMGMVRCMNCYDKPKKVKR